MIGILVAIVIVIATTYFILSGRASPTKEEDKTAPKTDEPTDTKKAAAATTTTKPKKTPTIKASRTHKPKPPSHPRFIRRFGGHSANITSFSLSPNGEWMATTGFDSQIRVCNVDKTHTHEFVQHHIEDHDRVTSLSWEHDGRTVACGMNRSGDVRFYRVRKKQEDPQHKHAVFPYELAELVKRRFNTESKLDDVSACVADQSCSTFHLILTSGESAAQHNQKQTAAWDGSIGSGEFLGMVKTGGGDVRLSKDGKFFCGRGAGNMNEVKIFEVLRKKVKGDVEPHFDKISAKSVMTLLSNAKVLDVAFLYNSDTKVCDRAVVATAEGMVQLWSLDVEYKLQEDTKLLCSATVCEKEIVAVDSSFEVDKFAVVTRDCALHVFSCSALNASKHALKLDFTIEGVHSGGVGDVLFCPKGNFVYTRSAAGKDVFAWKAT